MRPLRLAAYTLVNALGHGCAASLSALRQGRSGLRPCDLAYADLETWIGAVDGVDTRPVAPHLGAYDCRNNRLAQMAMQQDGFAHAVADAAQRYGASRVGLFVGTSTSGIRETERAYAARESTDAARLADFDYIHTHNIFSAAGFCAGYLHLRGPTLGISTACSSSAKVFAAAHRHMQAGLCDAAVVAGVDSLCQTTLYGFNSLELVSRTPCRPWSAGRDGISIGEGAGFALLEWADPGEDGVALLGYGESGDAWHMAAPHPEGVGSILAMERALDHAGLAADAIDYINLHGTATPSNDASEDKGVVAVFDSTTACSSTKGWTGHTLGAAGIIEAIFSCLVIEHGFLPGCLNTSGPDPALSAGILLESREQVVDRVMSNSFGFGGSNCSLIFGRTSL